MVLCSVFMVISSGSRVVRVVVVVVVVMVGVGGGSVAGASGVQQLHPLFAIRSWVLCVTSSPLSGSGCHGP
ncbi:hypothetical protein GCM10009740_17060 [Terrabacter terrae]|uniref:Secreted protein n=1 Tax=Terrabacter terrae TaxID=318434 RepID=A0ABN2U4U2_9MICO